jgi:hypothetical protein
MKRARPNSFEVNENINAIEGIGDGIEMPPYFVSLFFDSFGKTVSPNCSMNGDRTLRMEPRS